MRIHIKTAVAIIMLPSLVAGIALAAQDRYSLQVPGGLAFSEFRGYEDWQTIAVSHNGDKLATILGNPVMIEAFKAGIPGSGKPFPDGAKMAKIHWIVKKAEDQPGEPAVPGALHDTDFMVKDSKRFADSGGWGWAQFEYDPATEAFRPAYDGHRRRSTTPSAASPATRSWPTRITSSPPIRNGERSLRHCEERSDEAIRDRRAPPAVIASRTLAMTAARCASRCVLRSDRRGQ